jgi:glucan phosphoethanolaminetransferase (alkaline phosphatase superfamily)
MRISQSSYRRALFVHATIAAVVALVLALGVIPPVSVEASTGATTQRAVQAFWINFGLTMVLAATLVLIAIRSRGRSWLNSALHVGIGLLLMILGLALADAGSAYRSHGPSMQSASVILFVCAAADFLTGASIVVTPFLRQKRSQARVESQNE